MARIEISVTEYTHLKKENEMLYKQIKTLEDELSNTKQKLDIANGLIKDIQHSDFCDRTFKWKGRKDNIKNYLNVLEK